MKLINWLKELLCEEISQEQIDECIVDNDSLRELVEELTSEKEELLLEINECPLEEIEESFWNNKWKKSDIRYKFQGEFYKDARSLINYPSYIADKIIIKYGLRKPTEEETILAILKWCDTQIKYNLDEITWGKLEYWADSDITIQKLIDDCDGKAVVFKALCLAVGIPDYKVKVCAGWVIKPGTKSDKVGHAYPIYLWNDEWYVLDPTYYPDYTPFEERKIHKELPNYYPVEHPIWWSFSKEFCFAQKDLIISSGNI